MYEDYSTLAIIHVGVDQYSLRPPKRPWATFSHLAGHTVFWLVSPPSFHDLTDLLMFGERQESASEALLRAALPG